MNLPFALCIIYAGIIFGASSVPGNRLPHLFFADHILHLVEYMILGTLLAWWRSSTLKVHSPLIVVQATIFASLYGLTDEFHQFFVPGRSPDPADWVADTVGAFIGAFAVFGIRQIMSIDKRRR